MSTRDFVTGAAVGAALLFVLDPDRGAKRRAMLRDKLMRDHGMSIEVGLGMLNAPIAPAAFNAFQRSAAV